MRTDSLVSTHSVLERLAAVSPGTELWWDSSPLVFETWRARMLDAAAPEHRWELEEELLRLWDPEHPQRTLFRGVTTNPPLSLAALRDDPVRWSGWLHAYHLAHPDADAEEMFWAVYKEVVRLGAEMFMPLHEATGYRYGHISAQVDPRRVFETDVMVRQAIELAALSPNVMIKVPGTREGMTVLFELTRHGISTNCTLAYTLPQFVAAAEHVQSGLLEARANGVDLTHWRSVVTDMSARWENAPEFDADASAHGVTLTAQDKRWASIAVFKHAHRIFRRRAYPSKLLLCSIRLGPDAHRCWHVEHTAGADAVFTLPPSFLTDFIAQCEEVTFGPRIWEEIPGEVMAHLERVPYFIHGHEVDGLSLDDFDEIPSLLSTAREFSAATEGMVTFVREQVAAGC